MMRQKSGLSCWIITLNRWWGFPRSGRGRQSEERLVNHIHLDMPLFGIETEYGITREDLSDVDPVVESMELVRAHLTASFERRWDYAGEDPHEDARGFGVSRLRIKRGRIRKAR